MNIIKKLKLLESWHGYLNDFISRTVLFYVHNEWSVDRLASATIIDSVHAGVTHYCSINVVMVLNFNFINDWQHR